MTSKLLMESLELLDYKFTNPPVLIGGLALEQHKIRESGEDLDLMVSKYDWIILKEKYSDCLNLFGGKDEYEVDATLNIHLKNGIKIDLIKSLWQYDYIDFLKDSKLVVIDGMDFILPSLSDLLIIKSFPGILKDDNKSLKDMKLILEKIVKDKYNK